MGSVIPVVEEEVVGNCASLVASSGSPGQQENMFCSPKSTRVCTGRRRHTRSHAYHREVREKKTNEEEHAPPLPGGKQPENRCFLGVEERGGGPGVGSVK